MKRVSHRVADDAVFFTVCSDFSQKYITLNLVQAKI